MARPSCVAVVVDQHGRLVVKRPTFIPQLTDGSAEFSLSKAAPCLNWR
jgi:hypothetical protein